MIREGWHAGRVWTALRWQGFLKFLHIAGRWSCVRPVHAALPCAAGHNALRASQVPIDSSHSKVLDPQWVFPSRRFRPALCIHSCSPFPTLAALYKAPILCRDRTCKGRFAIAFTACHQRPDCARRFIGQGNCRLHQVARHLRRHGGPACDAPPRRGRAARRCDLRGRSRGCLGGVPE